MFDLDVSKLLVVCAVALVVVGPKDLPRVLRTVGQILNKAQRLKSELQKAVTRFADEADLSSIDKELATIENRARANFALDPAMTMRGRPTPGSGGDAASQQGDDSAPQYASPEMAAYLAPPPAQADGIDVQGGSEARPRDMHALM